MSEDIEHHIIKRFEILQKLGKGAYGVVWKARDKRSNKLIALKKVHIINRFLMLSIMPLMLKELIEKSYFYNS